MSTITGTEASDTLTGGPTTDLIEGLGGNDYLRDESGDNDIVRGNDGDDTIWVERTHTGAGGLITIDGGAGDDTIDATGYWHAPTYDWKVDGGDGNDSLELRYLTHFTADLGAGDDYIYVDMPTAGGVISLGSGVDRVAMVSDYGRDPGPGDRYLTINGLGAEDQIDLVSLTYSINNWDQVTNLFATGHLRATQSGADVLIDIDMDGSAGSSYGWNPLLRLTDRTLAQLSPLNLSGMPLNGGPIGLTYTVTAHSYYQYNGTYGADHLTVGEGIGDITLQGLAGDDVLAASGMGSGLWGGDGDDHLIGGGSNDSLEGGLGDDVIEGGGGENTLYFMSFDQGATFVVGKAGPQNTGFGWDTVTAVTEIRGTYAADHFSVDAAMTGAVHFYASSGDDILIGGAGNDQLYGEDGDDQVHGGAGDDALSDFGDGSDLYDGGGGYDTLTYDTSDRGVTIDLTVTTPQVGGYGALDVILNVEGLGGSSHADTLSGTDQANKLWGGYGDDVLIGRGGDDELNGANGDDTLNGGDGDDWLTGGIYAGDILAGDDVLIGGAGLNYMSGGGGRDTFVVGKGHDVIFDFQVGTDLVSVDDLFVLKVSEMIAGPTESPSYSEVYVTLSNGSEVMFERIRAADITDATFLGLKPVTLGGASADTLSGTAAADWIDGQGGADKLYGGGGTDRLSGGDGKDTVVGDQGADTLDGDGGDDSLLGGAGDDTLSGGIGNDTLLGGDGDDGLNGGDGDDILGGGLGKDTVDGGAGDDTLALGLGGDILDGGAGSDTLVLTSGFGAHVVRAVGDDWEVGSGAVVTTVRNVESVKFGTTVKTWAEFAAPASIDGLLYAASYSDLAKAFGTNANLAAQHYATQGKLEGRAPALFNPLVYAASNSDLTLAFKADASAALTHYLVQGVYENRPTTGFDGLIYAASNTDLAKAFGTDANAATIHYLVQGVHEHRPLSTFDPYLYLASNTDLLRASGADTDAALRQYLTQGVFEGRNWTSFDARAYAAANPEVAARVGANLTAAARDYVEHGFDAGLPTSGFDTRAYAASSVDLAKAFGVNGDAALTHYLVQGVHEHRPTSGFDAVAYLLSNGDLAGRTADAALTHWLEVGADEGRRGDGLFGRDQSAGHVLTTAGASDVLGENDRDWFVFQADANQPLHLAISGAASGAALAIYDSLGHLAAVDSNGDHVLDIVPTTAGSYYLTVVDGPAAAGAYDLGLTLTGSGGVHDNWLL